MGVYETPQSLFDNDPDDELCALGSTISEEPEYTFICFEHLRDLSAQWGWSEGERKSYSGSSGSRDRSSFWAGA